MPFATQWKIANKSSYCVGDVILTAWYFSLPPPSLPLCSQAAKNGLKLPSSNARGQTVMLKHQNEGFENHLPHSPLLPSRLRGRSAPRSKPGSTACDSGLRVDLPKMQEAGRLPSSPQLMPTHPLGTKLRDKGHKVQPASLIPDFSKMPCRHRPSHPTTEPLLTLPLSHAR